MLTDSHPQRHEMRLGQTHPSGAQEWFCPICMHRFVVQWEPTFNMIDLEAGDRRVNHVGSTNGLHIGLPKIRPAAPEEPLLTDELRAALDEVLKDIDLDNWLS
jgi:hypothetical protein